MTDYYSSASDWTRLRNDRKKTGPEEEEEEEEEDTTLMGGKVHQVCRGINAFVRIHTHTIHRSTEFFLMMKEKMCASRPTSIHAPICHNDCH